MPRGLIRNTTLHRFENKAGVPYFTIYASNLVIPV